VCLESICRGYKCVHVEIYNKFAVCDLASL